MQIVGVEFPQDVNADGTMLQFNGGGMRAISAPGISVNLYAA